MILNKQLLLYDLYIAFYDAKRHKSKKSYVKQFEKHLDKNLLELCEDLYNHTYIPLASTCFCINVPKPREIFAALFRDRIVLHLYYNYVHVLFERTFINDSYSCIKKRGTTYGFNRLNKAVRKESKNFTEEIYILQCDILGYFMHINRELLYNIIMSSLSKMRFHKIHKHNNITWDDTIDFDFVFYLTKEIALLDPTINCIITGNKNNFNFLPDTRSLFKQNNGCGLPIGNLTSQLFSNVYLNLLDLYIKRVLKIKKYGRYVDDFYILSHDRKELQQIIPVIKKFLEEILHLHLQDGKTVIKNVKLGIGFLGGFIKFHRTYILNKSLKRIIYKVHHLNTSKDIISSLNSFLGTLNRYMSFNIKIKLFMYGKYLNYTCYMNNNFSKTILNLLANDKKLNNTLLFNFYFIYYITHEN